MILKTLMKQSFDCIVIGAGIAGVTASIYLKRAGLKILLLEKKAIGGQIINTSEIENYPTIENIDGTNFSLQLQNQIKKLEIPMEYKEVLDIQINGDLKIVKTKNDEYIARNIIIATGRIPRKLNLDNEDKLLGRGISYCATCDGYFYKNKKVAIVGGGNSALEAAIYLSKICNSVTVINRSEKLRADEELQNEVKLLENVKILYNEEILSLGEQDGILSYLTLKNDEISVDGLFVYIGLVPTLPFIKNIDLKLESGYIVVNQKMETNIPGIYACGDIIKKDVYQIITAASEGAIAASSIR